MKITRIENLNYKEDVYDLMVPGTNNFYANSILVHNCGKCLPQ